MSPRTSDWKSQGETRTMSPTRTQTLLFSFPLILQRRSCPSWHFTMTRSKPRSLMAMPRTSLATGNCIFPKSSSLITFLLPNSYSLRAEAVITMDSVFVRKTMFLCGFVWGRALEPNCDSPRVIWLWLRGHRIPACFSSGETQTTRLIAPHCGHLT